MLTHLTINNFAIVSYQELEFQRGMTCITGETGAGKSIALDALALCLGERAESRVVRKGTNKTEISAQFNLSAQPDARAWLESEQLTHGQECILRRVVTGEGRSRAYINGNIVPIHQLKQLGERLVNLHGQHAHQQLLKAEHQRTILDAYAEHEPLLEQTHLASSRYQQLKSRLTALREEQQQRLARRQLLQYQTQELNELALMPDEYPGLELRHQQLGHFSELQGCAERCLFTLSENDRNNLIQQLQNVHSTLEENAELDQRLSRSLLLIQEALIRLEECRDELNHYQQHLEFDPDLYQETEQRISRVITLARKHRLAPEQLSAYHQTLLEELAVLEHSEHEETALIEELKLCHGKYINIAQALSASRQEAAQRLTLEIEHGIRQLNMEKGCFAIHLTQHPDETPSSNGIDRINFLVSLNPGQESYPLADVASGGELSRIALVIETIIAKKMATPTLIFDEVDVGISGATAARVGGMLRQLAEATQVIVVTHLPQVAGQGHHHLYVAKHDDGESTESTITPLDGPQRVAELARLLGGDLITSVTLANAKELLHEDALKSTMLEV